jgi:hypothetical protein
MAGGLSPSEFYAALGQLRAEIKADIRAEVGGVHSRLDILNGKTERNTRSVAAHEAEIENLKADIAAAPAARAPESPPPSGLTITLGTTRSSKAIGGTIAASAVLGVIQLIWQVLQAFMAAAPAVKP